MSNKEPVFIGIGAQRAGTSWLYHCMKEHPSIFLPQKEVHFFDRHYEKGVEWYCSLFDGNTNATAWGEFTPDYMYHKRSMELIKLHFANTKIIVILREPLDRAYSAFNLFKSHGRYKNLSFLQAIEQDPFLLKQSLYASQVEFLFDNFPRENVFVGFYDDVSKAPEKLVRELFSFLNVDSSYMPSALNTRKNVSAFSSEQRFLKLPAIQNWLMSSMFSGIYKKIKETSFFNGLKDLLFRAEQRRRKAQKVNIELPKEYNDLIKRDIEKLEHLLGRKIPEWH